MSPSLPYSRSVATTAPSFSVLSRADLLLHVSSGCGYSHSHPLVPPNSDDTWPCSIPASPRPLPDHALRLFLKFFLHHDFVQVNPYPIRRVYLLMERHSFRYWVLHRYHFVGFLAFGFSCVWGLSTMTTSNLDTILIPWVCLRRCRLTAIFFYGTGMISIAPAVCRTITYIISTAQWIGDIRCCA
ncbi:hypothetical protein ARMSODRAFT_183 [Armillaria solidipes]|uniref:Uncharacterized protein n=1 Tax=Armillaria solidipes TaxID=1076256 RepID=A0A2H3C3H4_9AGAR|nr:hypothetical protein ARMSODRAFT_183 [Armillaria solidipes]